jgi:CheY-like chemotaxis protein
VLIIEDELLIQQSLKKLLEKRGCNVDATSFGQEGLKLLENKKYNLVICDLMLKDITGFDILEESKKFFSAEKLATLFVIMTAYSSEQVLSKARDYGTIVLSKPFEDLQKTLDFFISKLEAYEEHSTYP